MIAEAEALLRRASALGSIGRYQLEAALQSAHVHRRRTGRANWAEVVELYDALLALTGSPVVALNRALALAELHGAASALEALREVAADARLTEYQPYWAARAELLARRRRAARSARRVRDRDRSGTRPGGAPLPAAQPRGLPRRSALTVLADLVLVAHLGFIVFAVFGGLLALRHRWAPFLHLPCVAWGAFVELSGRVCPLTPLENALRSQAGEAAYGGSFVEHYLVPIVYPSGLSAELQVFLAVILVLWNAAVYAVVVRRRRLVVL